MEQFGVVPSFRIGVHGGEVVVSEQGDTKRAIGVYGTTINIAARMEEAAKTHNVACAISGDVAENLRGEEARLIPIGHEKIRGSAVEIPIYEYRVAGEGCANAVRRVPLQASPPAEPG
jgi:class 3 adenylate cyclase